LKRLPLCELKIDKLFVKQLFDDADDVAIAKMIIALGSSLGLAVIAEGVETEEHRDFLAKLGCYQYQGYYYGRPLPVAEFESTIGHGKEFISVRILTTAAWILKSIGIATDWRTFLDDSTKVC
jgi:EAL domain-containing protein (putative c-di-GMP-specific phosphodiesterase class I)